MFQEFTHFLKYPFLWGKRRIKRGNLFAFQLSSPSSLDEPAIVATLEPCTYTAVVGGANNSSGYSLLEIYDYPE